MIKLKFSEFIPGDYDKCGERHVIYVLTAESHCLYVGMSKANVWARWFGYPGSHMFQYSNKQWGYSSPVGEAIVKCLPDSLEWTIELWTAKDSVSFLSQDPSLGRLDPRDILELEWLMIDKLHPALNTSSANYIVKEADLPKIVRRYKQQDQEKALAAYHKAFK